MPHALVGKVAEFRDQPRLIVHRYAEGLDQLGHGLIDPGDLRRLLEAIGNIPPAEAEERY